LRGDLKSRYDSYAIGRNWGWLSANDIRALEDMNPLPGNIGDKYLVPLNMAPADQVALPPAAPPPQEPPEDRALQMLIASAQRVVNYENRRLDKRGMFDVYNDGDLTHKIKDWLITDYSVSERYARIAEQLNLIADEKGISDDELTACKVDLLVKLVTNKHITDEAIYETAF